MRVQHGKKFRAPGFLLAVLGLLLLFPSPGYSQEGPSPAASRIETLATLESLAASLDQVNGQVEEIRKTLMAPEGEARREELLKNLDESLEEKEALEQSFEQVAAGVDLKAFDEPIKFQFDWATELKDLLSPIFAEIRALTDRPRELERLRREAAYEQEKLVMIEKAQERLAKLVEASKSLSSRPEGEVLIQRLQDLRKKWGEDRVRTNSNLAAVNHRLSEKLAERRNLFESAQNLFASFFKSRGRNLLVAIFTFILVLIAFRFCHRSIEQFSPWRRKGGRSFYIRLADVIYYAVTFAASILAFLAVLYLYGDWVLLGLALIFLFGLAWAARKGLPLFWQQAQLLLNLGTVREGEEVIMDGLPWRVETINVYTQLVNPRLRGGRRRLPLRDLVELRSRVRAADEPWFPCREGDWVFMADGTRGKVTAQTPEMVSLVYWGAAVKPTLPANFWLNVPKTYPWDFV